MVRKTYYSARGCPVTTTAKPRNSVARVVAIDDGIYSRTTRCSSKTLAGQAIREQGIDLASSSDSGELRRVSAEYALEHLQLAYASTVHGIQGETADASIVGPDVDAAGLYVGLTRGRIHNVAIAVARTDDVAREAAAQSMMRGTPELTMQDAVRAAEAELRRAARDVAETAWSAVAAPAASHGIRM